jgi:23S rRNA (cytidine1920-2'-O)/16S rRNA (cytidine1409-2'-O)-methyltransferase
VDTLKERLDKILTELGLVSSRSQAKSLIEKGDVTVNGEVLTKAGEIVDSEASFVVNSPAFVGRGAFKLLKALEELNVVVKDLVMLDVGSSTGGFTEVLLLNGAKKVYAIDVGREQLASKLRGDPRVVSMEGTNIRDLSSLPDKAHGAVVDLSFISLNKVLDAIYLLLVERGFALVLIKPQFEAGPERLPKDGVIKDSKVREDVLKEVHGHAQTQGWSIQQTMTSPIEGKNGNVEFLSLLVKN